VPLSAVLAVTAAVGCAQLVEARVPAAVLAGTLLVASAWGPVDAAVRRVIDARADDRTYRDAFVKADFSAAKDERIWGYEPAVFFLSHRSSATRFGYTLPVVGEGGRTRLVNRYRAELVADVRRDPPPYVVIVEGDTNPVVPDGSRRAFEEFPELESFVSSRYEEVVTIGHDATVLRLQPS
jgi:hypothetical protein